MAFVVALPPLPLRPRRVPVASGRGRAGARAAGRTACASAAGAGPRAAVPRRAALSVAAAALLGASLGGGGGGTPPAAAYSSRTQNDLSNAAPTRYDGAKEVRTESGLRYLDLAVGGEAADGEDGGALREGDKVTIYYTSRLWGYNGIVLDSTNDHKRDGLPEPFVFVMGDPAVVPGLQEMVSTMRVGGKRRAVLPPPIGYQSATMKPTPADFPSMRRLRSVLETSRDATIVFDVELLKVKRAAGRAA